MFTQTTFRLIYTYSYRGYHHIVLLFIEVFHFLCPGSTMNVMKKKCLYASSEESERQALEDLKNRARLSSSALPSVSFYSFINTHSR